MIEFQNRLAVVQRVLPRYRAEFFDQLAEECKGGFHLFAGQPRTAEAIATATELRAADFTQGLNLHILGGSLYLCWQIGLINWLERTDPDVLILEANPRYLSSARAIHWMKSRRRPVVGWGLGAPSPLGLLASLRTARRRSFLGQFDALVAYSSRGADEYRALGLPHESIFLAPNVVAPRPVGPPPKRKARFKGPPRLLFVGRLQPRKGLDRLLRACARLPKKLQPRLQIVGEGPARPALERIAAATYPQTEFTGTLYDADLEAAFRHADLFVLPGTGGLAIQQAMSHALPIIAAQGDGTQEDLVDIENGVLVSPGNETALTSALLVLLSDSRKLRQMGEASYKKVRDRYNLEGMVAAFLGVLHAVTS